MIAFDLAPGDIANTPIVEHFRVLEFLKKDFPNNHGEIKHALADGDLVALHIHNQRSPELRGNAVVDLFRIENGKVVEHWDVVQAIPDPQKAKNSNTMF